MNRSLATRLTALYAGGTFLLLLAMFGVLTSGTLRLYGRVTGDALGQASREAVALFASERARGVPFEAAALRTLADVHRPILNMAFVDDRARIFGALPHRATNGAAGFLAAVAGFEVVSVPVSGGRLIAGPKPSLFLARLEDYWRTAIPIELGVVILAIALGHFVTRQAIAPLLDVTRSLQALAGGNFIARPVTTAERDEIGELARAYNAAALGVQTAFAERQQAQQRMRQFIADAGHELRTPLTVVMGYLENLEDGAISDPELVRRVYASMRAECRRMRRLVERLILLARLDGPEPRPPQSLSFGELVAASVEPFLPLAPNLQLELAADACASRVRGDPDELREAIACVVDNALKYAPGAAVYVRADRLDGSARVRIGDDGPGMEAADRERAFERFYRGDSRGEVAGTGLGLSIARRAVERAEGSISLESERGRGTTVTLQFPLGPGPGLRDASAAEQSRAP